MPLSTINTDIYIDGSLACRQFVPPAASINKQAIEASAGIEASKLEHQYEHTQQMQDSITDAAVARRVVHVVKGAAATLEQFAVGAVTAPTGNATVTIDLKKNGSTVLSGTITLDNGTAAFALKTPAGYTSTALVAGDVLEFHITAVNAGSGALPKGVFCRLTIREAAQ